jgi:ABC-2 type transport system permease protein
MINLLRTEWLKIKRYTAFWLIISITALSYPGMSWIMKKGYDDISHRKNGTGDIVKMLLGYPFSLPEAWHTLAYSSSLFVFIPAVVVIMFITNEYTYKTQRQNVIDGWSRDQFMLAKMMNVLIVAAVVSLLYMAVTLVIGLTNGANENATTNAWSQSYYIGLFALQTFSQLSIAFLIGFLVRKAFLALGIFLFYFLILENVMVGLGSYYKIYAYKYLPLEMSDRMIPPPAFWGRFDKDGYLKGMSEINYFVAYTAIFTVVLWLLCFWINRRRDL